MQAEFLRRFERVAGLRPVPRRAARVPRHTSLRTERRVRSSGPNWPAGSWIRRSEPEKPALSYAGLEFLPVYGS
jgi:hypothetical protein